MFDFDAAAELQQELREMFAVDTQQHLEAYFSLIQQLNDRTWQADIQHLYRAIHTIKGGAVTVAAEGMLHAAMVLEDLLADLRYLEAAPNLSDGKLEQILLEAGELLISTIEITDTGDLATLAVKPTVDRITQLWELVKHLYLPEWDELKQVHQEFAEQGFELVILELEMALGNLPTAGIVSLPILDIAQTTITQLRQIGVDLELASGWELLLKNCEQLINQPDSQLWRQIWVEYFPVLKDCVKNSGEPNHLEIDRLAALADSVNSLYLASSSEPATIIETPEYSPDLVDILDDFFMDSLQSSGTEIESDDFDLPDLLDDFFIDEEVETFGLVTMESAQLTDPLVGLTDSLDDFFSELEPELAGTSVTNHLITPPTTKVNEDLIDLLDAFFTYEEIELTPAETEITSILHPRPETDLDSSEFTTWNQDDISESVEVTLLEPATESTNKTPLEPSKRSIQIPVPLERLDKSATQVVDTLLTARAVMNVSNQLQSQLKQLTNLTQESAQYVTRLRQLQDDYALMRNISEERDSENNVNLERYRQGYTTINRLLENILRMSELGQEIETATYQSSSRLDALDRSILNLKDGIETSRLIPFRNLTLRAKAILRDLTNRYQKPAQLIAENEQVELDAGIIQQLEPALLHLLRNAYDHGLESVFARESVGKPAQGTIKISLNRQGNLYRLVISDDGGGIDRAKIASIARSKGFPLHQTRTNAELLAVLCQPGFSSNSSVSEVSGRGVGMDVVATQITSIGGQMRLETTIGKGTTFSLEVPAPQLLVPCILLQVGERTIALPTDEVLETALMTSMAAEFSLESTNFCNWKLTTPHGKVPGFDLANYWQQFDRTHSGRTIPDTAICIRTRQPDGTAEIWSIADELLGQSELLINPLPSPLIAPVGLLGVSLQADGTLISILDPIAITTSIAIAQAPTTSQPATQSTHPKSSTPIILIVDDAAMMRRRFEASLNANGFITHTCNDGLEALTWLQTNPHPDLMITDVEMPNMDGFTLIDRARQSNIDIPILVVSSRLSEEWGKEARRLGANDYLNKGFSTPELLQRVDALLGVVASVGSG